MKVSFVVYTGDDKSQYYQKQYKKFGWALRWVRDHYTWGTYFNQRYPFWAIERRTGEFPNICGVQIAQHKKWPYNKSLRRTC